MVDEWGRQMSDDLVNRLREKAFRTETYELLEEAADRIEKLEAALLWYAEHCQKGGDDIEGPYGDYGQRARKALEDKQ